MKHFHKWKNVKICIRKSTDFFVQIFIWYLNKDLRKLCLYFKLFSMYDYLYNENKIRRMENGRKKKTGVTPEILAEFIKNI